MPASRRRTAPSRWTCSATPCGPRASTQSTCTTTSPPAYATTGRNSTAACAPCGRATCSSSGSSTAWAATSPISSTPCKDLSARGVGLRGARRPGRADRHHHRGRPPRVRHLRGAGSVAESPADASCTVTATMAPGSRSTPSSALWAKCVRPSFIFAIFASRILRRLPRLVRRRPVLPGPVEAGQLRSRRRLNPRRLRQPPHERLVRFARVPRSLPASSHRRRPSFPSPNPLRPAAPEPR